MRVEHAATARLLQGERIEGLKPHHFEDPKFRKIWKAAEEFDKPSPGLVKEKDDTLSTTYLENLEFDLVGETNDDLRKAVIEGWVERRIQWLYSQFRDGNMTQEELIDSITTLRSSGNTKEKQWKSLGEATLEAMDQVQSGKTIGIPCGFPSVSNFIGPLEKGALVTIAGYTGQGKTAFAWNMALEIAKDYKVGVISLEMKAEELAFRGMAILSGVPASEIKANRVPPEGLDNLSRAVKLMDDDLDIWIDDSPTADMAYVESVVRGNPPDILFVDHLHLLSAGKESRVADVGDMSRRFKLLAMELDIPIVLLAQLRKLGQETKIPKPKLDDLKDSSGIQQDSNAVMMVYMTETEPDVMRILIRKNRGGSLGEAILKWEPSLTRLTDYVDMW